MRGIVYTGEGVEVTDALEVRDPGPNEVQIRIQAAGVCHSDLSVIDGTIPFPAPAVLGHEGAGRDPVAFGREVLGWSRGAMANYKVPRGVVLVEALPVNASGKVLKRELRQRYADGADNVVTNES